MWRSRVIMLLVASALVGAGAVYAQHAAPGGHGGHMADDTRVPVHLPPEMRAHMLASMRDHLAALQEIQEALASDDPARGAHVAEQRLGMTSLQAHDAARMAKFMPQGMQDVGSAMHRAASRLAIKVQDAAVTGDRRPAIAAMAEVMAQCVGCHAGYRLP